MILFVKSGIRYLDLRVSNLEETISISHFAVFAGFDDIINDIDSFLRDNPNEILIVRIKGDYYQELSDWAKENILNKLTQTFRGRIITEEEVKSKSISDLYPKQIHFINNDIRYYSEFGRSNLSIN